MRGVILAGGTGSRLRPITAAVNKHLLPIYNKPMIYYPLSTLLLAGISELMIVSSKRDLVTIESLLGQGQQFGISIRYRAQDKPRGIADGIKTASEFIRDSRFALILGDNIFHGSGMGETLKTHGKTDGATIFAHEVSNPSDYGVVFLDEKGLPTRLEEKPKIPMSSLAVPGLYFYDETALARVESLVPSRRGELEVSDLNASYLSDGMLKVVRLPRGTVWLDAGTVESMFKAAEFVRVLEDRKGQLISSPHEIAWRLGRVESDCLRSSAELFNSSDYGRYLAGLT